MPAVPGSKAGFWDLPDPPGCTVSAASCEFDESPLLVGWMRGCAEGWFEGVKASLEILAGLASLPFACLLRAYCTDSLNVTL